MGNAYDCDVVIDLEFTPVPGGAGPGRPAAEIIEVVSLVKVSDRVAEDAAEVEPYLGDMGLNPPLAVVTVQLADGGTYSLFIGGIVPETTYRYFRWSEDPGVFMCDTGVGDVFLLEKNRLRPVQQPVIASGLVDRVSIQKGEGLVEVSLSADAGGNLSAMLTSPFQYPMDETYLSALKTALDNFRLGALERAYSEDISAEYGFDDPLAVVTLHQKGGVRMMTDETGALTTIQMGETSFRFTFGRLEGEYYYTCLYEGNVYLVSRYLVETLVMAEGEKWASLYPFRMDSSRMGSILITTPSATLDIHAAYREQVSQNNTILLDEEGNIAYDITVSVNGKPWNTDAFDTLVARLFMLRASGSVPEGFSIEGKTPRWSMKLTTVFGQTRLVEAYSMDSFSDVLAVDGTVLHYVHYETLQTLLGELAQEISF
jgi:hypothetical protein